jgi:hypothetical protein
MHRTIQFPALPILAAAALVGSGLMFPASAGAQSASPEHALLNHSIAAHRAPGFSALWAPTVGNPTAVIGEAERALLGRTAADEGATSYRTPTTSASQLARPVTGEQALLGKRTGE